MSDKLDRISSKLSFNNYVIFYDDASLLGLIEVVKSQASCETLSRRINPPALA